MRMEGLTLSPLPCRTAATRDGGAERHSGAWCIAAPSTCSGALLAGAGAARRQWSGSAGREAGGAAISRALAREDMRGCPPGDPGGLPRVAQARVGPRGAGGLHRGLSRRAYACTRLGAPVRLANAGCVSQSASAFGCAFAPHCVAWGCQLVGSAQAIGMMSGGAQAKQHGDSLSLRRWPCLQCPAPLGSWSTGWECLVQDQRGPLGPFCRPIIKGHLATLVQLRALRPSVACALARSLVEPWHVVGRCVSGRRCLLCPRTCPLLAAVRRRIG